ncbi:hypothetical protein HPULCUR_010971 [Helicostylum pulchrum]|uniref:Uncharacterized protein n=1 Tax=Helicostylum pulchrum TaxID=562976 RepID=A0ABP9YER9_9FUNG
MADLISLGHYFRYNSLGGLLVTYALYLSKLRESITTEMTVPDKTSSIIGSEIFYVLEVNLLVLYNGEECRILNYSLSNCPRLQSLNVTYTTADSSNASFSLKHKEGLISSDQANCDFNVLQMEYTRPTKHFFDLVTTRLRNIEIVSVKTEDWSLKYCYYNDPVIDLTGFKKLMSFKYTSTSKHLTNEDNYFLIKYTNGTKRRILEYGKTEGMNNPVFTVLCDVSVSLYFCEEEIEN